MRALALLLPLLLAACGSEGPDTRPPIDTVADEEYAVLSAALREHAGGATVFVVQRETTACTDGPFGCDGYGDPAPDFPAPPDDVLQDFLARNAASVLLDDRFDADLEVVLLTRDEIDAIHAGGELFSALAAAYPGSEGLTYLSRVGFDRSMTTALVSYGNQVAPLAGAGYLELYRKIDGVWVLQAQRMTWIS